MVVAARHARLVNKHWKEVYQHLEPRLGRNRAIVAVARQMLVAVWHTRSVSKRQPDRFADWGKVATNFMATAYDDFGGAEHIPGGRTAPEFTRWYLDTIGVCERMQRVKFSGKTYRSVTQGVSRVLRNRVGSRPRVNRALGDRAAQVRA